MAEDISKYEFLWTSERFVVGRLRDGGLVIFDLEKNCPLVLDVEEEVFHAIGEKILEQGRELDAEQLLPK